MKTYSNNSNSKLHFYNLPKTKPATHPEKSKIPKKNPQNSRSKNYLLYAQPRWKNNNKNFSGVAVLADKEKNTKQKIN